MPEYFAHSANQNGTRHELSKHLRDVATTAYNFAEKFGAGEFGYWAGLWHDLGKFTQAFQDYLKSPDRKRGPDHSTAGAILAFPIFDEIARMVAGHHGGLPNNTELEKRLRDKAKNDLATEAKKNAEAAMAPLLPSNDLTTDLPNFLASAAPGENISCAFELFSRMVFSALTDADFLDTERHFNSDRHAQRFGTPELQDFWSVFEENQKTFSGRSENRLQAIRHEIYQHCLKAALAEPGIFSLTVPTGGGKSRSGLAFALKHALRWNLDRVIVAIPYTSIIEQTADVYRNIFKDNLCPFVLEHHSAVAAPRDENSDPVTFDAAWHRLASENWDAPLIVTTTVQLFESLFANRPARCRKLHNIARSVLILDEVQTLPAHLLIPILDVIQQLAGNYRVSIVLCTATQPALKSHAAFRGLKAVREIIPDPARYFTELKRVNYELPGGEPWSWARVAEEMRTEKQALAIVNTKRDAFALLAALGDDPSALHLSTQMCGIHRLETLKEVKRRLEPANREACRLVSTQVLEAGVDLDFPLVLRAIGPLDRIVQAAGRCNREGKLEKNGRPVLGRVVIFEPADGGMPPGVYETAMSEAVSLLRRGCDLDDPATYERYFRLLFGTVGKGLDKQDIQKARARFDYPQVAQRFCMIEDDTAAVIVRPQWSGHAATVDRLLGLMRSAEELPRQIFRKLQPYIVNIRSCAIPRFQSEGLIREVIPDSGVWEWQGRYDKKCGIVDVQAAVELQIPKTRKN